MWRRILWLGFCFVLFFVFCFVVLFFFFFFFFFLFAEETGSNFFFFFFNDEGVCWKMLVLMLCIFPSCLAIGWPNAKDVRYVYEHPTKSLVGLLPSRVQKQRKRAVRFGNAVYDRPTKTLSQVLPSELQEMRKEVLQNGRYRGRTKRHSVRRGAVVKKYKAKYGSAEKRIGYFEDASGSADCDIKETVDVSPVVKAARGALSGSSSWRDRAESAGGVLGAVNKLGRKGCKARHSASVENVARLEGKYDLGNGMLKGDGHIEAVAYRASSNAKLDLNPRDGLDAKWNGVLQSGAFAETKNRLHLQVAGKSIADANVHGDAMAGAEAKGKAVVSVNPWDLQSSKVDASVGAIAGARARATAKGSFLGGAATFGATAVAVAGAGAGAKLKAGCKKGVCSFDIGGEAALVAGSGVYYGGSINVKKVREDARKKVKMLRKNTGRLLKGAKKVHKFGGWLRDSLNVPGKERKLELTRLEDLHGDLQSLNNNLKKGPNRLLFFSNKSKKGNAREVDEFEREITGLEN